MKISKYGPNQMQKALDECYQMMHEVNTTYGDMADHLRNRVHIKNWLNFWNIAICLSDKQIRLSKKWYAQPIAYRAGTLVHEMDHIQQYKEYGKFKFWSQYLFNKDKFETKEDNEKLDFVKDAIQAGVA